MGCTSSTSRRTVSRLDKVEEAMPISPSMSLSDVPVILESPASTTGYHPMSAKLSTPPSVQPPRRRLHRRRRREPHLDHHLTDRLEMLARYLQRASKIDYQEALHAQTQKAIDDLLDNIHSFFFLYEAEKRPLWRLAQTGRLVQQVESFHRTLDAITARCGLAVLASSGAGPSLPRWQARWRRMRAEELELLERTFTFVAGCCNNSMHFETQLRMMSLPEWFVAPYERTKQQHKWQRAAVTIQKAPRRMTSGECFKLASSWSRLQHPHVMKLYGACHVGRKRFFVVAGGTPLTRCLGTDGFPLWRAFHEAALALRYLHQRRVGLESLSCADFILFRNGDRDAVMLAGFNLIQMKSALESSGVFGSKNTKVQGQDPLLEDDASDASYDDVDMIQADEDRSRLNTLEKESLEGSTTKYWQAPELLHREFLGPTEASDVFALGMCVIEAFSGGNVWSTSVSSSWNTTDLGKDNVKQALRDGTPPKPAALDDAWQWALVERMCSHDPNDRPSLTEVLASFQVFAEEEEKTNIDFSSTRRRKKNRRLSLRKTQSRATSASIACALSEVQAWCDEASESSALNYQLYERMDDVAARLEAMDTNYSASHLPVLASVIFRFRDFLQRHVNENPMLRLAATRQVIETIIGLHIELDALMDKLRFNRSGASIHSWTPQHESYRDQLWKRMRLSWAIDGQTLSAALDGEQELSLLGVLLAFEVKERSTSYTSEDLDLLRSTLVKVTEMYQVITPSFRTIKSSSILPLKSWFIPPYEVLFNELDAFRCGAFGSVHFGKWMNYDVVIKKVLTPEQPGVFTPLRSRQGDKTNAKECMKDPYQQFLNEVSAWSSLKHPNVLKLFGACHVGQHRFLVYEYAAQGPIDCVLDATPAEMRGICARRLLHEAALGLHYLHAQNIVHADLRCNNILIDAEGVVKLTDFGFSSLKSRRRTDDSTIESDSVDGAYRWVAPECLHGESPTFASNVYSFAMCAIEAVSGELPWGFEMTETAVRSKVRKGLLPPRPANCFSDSEWGLIARMCCYDPNARITINDVVKLLV
ncbi:TKL protein kinase [Phytophthora palmivora]|uniref:TKL protein kinase n=1 Tax=Phytophthora palmivora TaxID=4796 RepID=A0A2P4XSP9_9STRA|nr:TKL protein kinase [Phytophthora palmivora]